ncbi:MAG: YaiO family outer membrane beta-barrel protein [Bacteroidales bacterium]|jgi:YaiO family outer membrane protein|nr:YaiO family outer membrane beta-barrel protein [Bacteroidales bacterium]
MTRIQKIIYYTFCCLLLSAVGYSQQKPDADSIFYNARNAAFSNKWAEARNISRYLLSLYPDYYDAMILIGKTYAWESKPDSVRLEIEPLLMVEPDNYDALDVLSNNEIWIKEYDNALKIIEKALFYYPSDENFLYKKANVYYLKGDEETATIILQELLKANPEHVAGNELLSAIRPKEVVLAEIYDRAEENVRIKNWKESRRLSRKILAEAPDYFPASLLIAQTYAFENRFDSSRLVARELYKSYPDNYDLLELMVNTEIWDKKYPDALEMVDKALVAYPEDEAFWYKKAWIQYLQKDYKNALKTLDRLFDINPRHEEGNKLYRDINENFRDYVLLESYFEYFKEPYLSRKLITSAGLSKWTKYGTYIFKTNFGEELPYESLAFQIEAEAYQNLFPTNYLYLDYAFSPNSFFPMHRAAIEFFQRLPKGLEASLGVRLLYWNKASWIYTGSISWLFQKNYLAFRPFFSYADSKWKDSYTLTYRRYFSEREDYVYVLIGYGPYNDDFIQFNPNPGDSYLAQIGLLKFITNRWFILTSLGYAYDAGYRNRFMATAGVRYYFNMFK